VKPFYVNSITSLWIYRNVLRPQFFLVYSTYLNRNRSEIHWTAFYLQVY